MRCYDFRRGNTYWGHALHADTFRGAPSRLISRGWFRRPEEVPRVSVMVHTSPPPNIGDQVVYTTKSGERFTKIVEVRGGLNVEDMYTLTLEERL